jgi:hypothetical protein
MYIRLRPLVKWPDRGELLQTMPMEFWQRYGKYVINIDCFEVFMERPTNLQLKARAQTISITTQPSFLLEYPHKVLLLSYLKGGVEECQMFSWQSTVVHWKSSH